MNKNNDIYKLWDAVKTVINLAFDPWEQVSKILEVLTKLSISVAAISLMLIQEWDFLAAMLCFLFFVAAVKIQMQTLSKKEKRNIKSQLYQLEREGLQLQESLYNNQKMYGSEQKEQIDDWAERIKVKLFSLAPEAADEWERVLKPYAEVKKVGPGKYVESLTTRKSTEADALIESSDWANYLQARLIRLFELIEKY